MKKEISIKSILSFVPVSAYISPLLFVFFLTLEPATAMANPGEPVEDIDYLKSLTLEDLLQAEITSVSKSPEKLADATAAVFVITAEDIERSGIRSVPEALRLAPGIQVAQINANKWAISSRGFNGLFSNKLLVLLDGRSVYTPLFSGVFWELQDTVMEDIDRIEVIRGPGATLWGANAVNGVINIITKAASDTQGTLVSVGSGSSQPYIFSARYGGPVSDTSHYRLYVKGAKHDSLETESGEDAHDAWKNLKSGFKADLTFSDDSTLTVQGDVVKGEEEVTYSFPGILTGKEAQDIIDYKQASLLAKWEKKYSNDSVATFQTYYDYSNIEAKVPQDNRHTFDVDFQYMLNITQSQALIWGLGYRVTKDNIEANELITFTPESRTDHLYSAFLQDEIMVVEDRWWVTLGSKFEHNDYSGFEIQPNIRMRYKPAGNQTLWGAISRAVRTPSRADHDFRALSREDVDYFGNRYQTIIFGNNDFEPEELVAYEIGHRYAPTSNLSFDTALFYNDYENLRSIDLGTPFTGIDTTSPYLVLPLNIGNNISAETYGIEVLTSWQPLQNWKLAFSYSFLKVSLHLEPGADWSTQEFEEDNFPQQQVQFRSYFDLTDTISFDTELYYVDELSSRDIDPYLRLDLRLAWQMNENVNINLNGENLLNSKTMEFGNSNGLVASETERKLFLNLTWEY